jgi:hypothetical protein
MKKHEFICIFIIGILPFLPRIPKTIRVYENMLWTNQANASGRLKNSDYYFSFGINKKDGNSWNRYRFGWPIATITMDKSTHEWYWLVRVEKDEFRFHVVFIYIFVIPLYLFYCKRRKRPTERLLT